MDKETIDHLIAVHKQVALDLLALIQGAAVVSVFPDADLVIRVRGGQVMPELRIEEPIRVNLKTVAAE